MQINNLNLLYADSDPNQIDFRPMIFLWWKTQEITRYDSLECLEMKAAIEVHGCKGKLNFFAPNYFFYCVPVGLITFRLQSSTVLRNNFVECVSF